MDWCLMGEDCYRGLFSVTIHLLSRPLDRQTEAQFEVALGTFYNPSSALTDRVIFMFHDRITLLARMFFRNLL
ncbi:WD repeat-containing and planar cell polarity effector protein fritz homolog, partial [Tachysurus ichikawai]